MFGLSQDEFTMVMVVTIGGMLFACISAMIIIKREPKPVKTKMLDRGSINNNGSAVGRAIVGDIVAGPIGAVVGAASANKGSTDIVVFRVWYSDGTNKVEQVQFGTQKYMDYIKIMEE